MSIDSLKGRIEQIRGRIEVVRGRGEEATKQALVLPMLDALGYDIWNPAEVSPEFDADFAVRRGSQKERVDLAVLLSSTPSIFIEVKSADTSLDGHHGQLARYFNSVTAVSLAILTNGVEYRFFTDTTEPNVMDSRPFHVANLESVDLGVDVLARFHKSRFAANEIREYASDLIYTARLVAFLRDQLDRGQRPPTEEFVRWILASTDMYDGRVMASVVERFQPLVRNALQVVVRGIVRRSVFAIESGINEAPEDEAAATEESVPGDGGGPDLEEGASEEPERRSPRRGIETTDAELAAFDAIRGLFHDSPFQAAKLFDGSTRKLVDIDLGYKDTTAYFGVYFNKPSWWFARLNLDAKNKWLAVNLTEEEAAPHIQDPSTIMSGIAFAQFRVRLDGPEDVTTYRGLLLAAMGKVIAERSDPGA